MTKALGRYIVSDPAICHGKATFVGTRILVADVLEQAASGKAWEAIVDDWRGDINKDAIVEAVRLARGALLAQEHTLISGIHDAESEECALMGHRAIALTAEDSRVFTEAMMNPAPANDKLRSAMRRRHRAPGR